MKLRPLFRAVVVAATLIVAAPVVLPASPAAASLGEGGQGPGIGGPGGGSDGGTGGTTSVCRADRARGYTTQGNTLRSVFFPRCFGPGTAWNYSRWVCPVGFTAMRFWGDATTPVRGYTISRVNYSNEDLLGCGERFPIGGSPRSVIFPYHPDDAGPAVGAPWRATSTPRRYTSSGVPAIFDYGFLRGNAVRTAFTSTARSTTNLYGTDVPFTRGPLLTGQPCTVLQTTVMADLVNDPVRGDAVRLGFAKTYLASRISGQNHAAGLVVANLSSVSPRIRTLGDQLAGRAGASSDVLTSVAAGEVVPDNVPCSSALDFVPQPDAPATHYGACYAPIVAPGWGYAPSSSSSDTVAVSYMTQVAPTYESWTWAGTGGFAGDDDAVTRAARRALGDHLRLTVFLNNLSGNRDAAERAAQMFAGPSNGLELASRWADPTRYMNNHGIPDNRNRYNQVGDGAYWERAAQSLETHARCSVAYHNPLTTEEGVVATPDPDGIVIRLDVPRYGQVGGQVLPASVTATADLALQCGNRPCGGDVRINSLTWELGVSGTAGYDACARETQLGCEYRVASNPETGRAVKTGERFDLHFYNATGRNETVRAAVSGIAISADKRSTTSYTVNIPVDPSNPAVTFPVTITEENWEPVTIPVTVVDNRTGNVIPAGSGLSFRVVNGTPTPD